MIKSKPKNFPAIEAEGVSNKTESLLRGLVKSPPWRDNLVPNIDFLNTLVYNVKIECSDTIRHGVLRRALTDHCVTIAMSRSLKSRHGSYADEIVNISPIPVLIAGQGKE